ncbi:MAG: hypothetical protein KAI81_08565, partial [Candidatus Marinimicrobia bacterium]|nr:hypothetical protein [Candidatus Neomarinimicrobiota bacterium]
YSDVIIAQIKVWLEAAYDINSDTMRTSLQSVLPFTSPYYAGDVSVGLIPEEVVDWIAVELRSESDGEAIDSLSMFLKKDGSIVMPDGISKPTFTAVTAGEYYVVIRHRNHLALMSKNKASINPMSHPSISMINLSDIANIYGDGSGIKQLESTVYGMISGETNNSNIITNSDKDAVIADKNKQGYYPSDTNFSGIVTNSDKDAIIENKNLSSSVP